MSESELQDVYEQSAILFLSQTQSKILLCKVLQDNIIWVCKITKNVSYRLYHIQNLKNGEQSVLI